MYVCVYVCPRTLGKRAKRKNWSTELKFCTHAPSTFSTLQFICHIWNLKHRLYLIFSINFLEIWRYWYSVIVYSLDLPSSSRGSGKSWNLILVQGQGRKNGKLYMFWLFVRNVKILKKDTINVTKLIKFQLFSSIFSPSECWGSASSKSTPRYRRLGRSVLSES